MVGVAYKRLCVCVYLEKGGDECVKSLVDVGDCVWFVVALVCYVLRSWGWRTLW